MTKLTNESTPKEILKVLKENISEFSLPELDQLEMIAWSQIMEVTDDQMFGNLEEDDFEDDSDGESP